MSVRRCSTQLRPRADRNRGFSPGLLHVVPALLAVSILCVAAPLGMAAQAEAALSARPVAANATTSASASPGAEDLTTPVRGGRTPGRTRDVDFWRVLLFGTSLCCGWGGGFGGSRCGDHERGSRTGAGRARYLRTHIGGLRERHELHRRWHRTGSSRAWAALGRGCNCRHRERNRGRCRFISSAQLRAGRSRFLESQRHRMLRRDLHGRRGLRRHRRIRRQPECPRRRCALLDWRRFRQRDRMRAGRLVQGQRGGSRAVRRRQGWARRVGQDRAAQPGAHWRNRVCVHHAERRRLPPAGL